MTTKDPWKASDDAYMDMKNIPSAPSYEEFRTWAYAQGAEFPTDGQSFRLWLAEYLDAAGIRGRDAQILARQIYADPEAARAVED